MRKLKKLIRSPGVFFRDYFNKRYPNINCEQAYTEDDENIVLKSSLLQVGLEPKSLLDVDVVFTWVNGSDSEWQAKKQKFVQQSEKALYANNSARFENHNELYYAVLSVKKYLPWVRKIFIVTDQQIPDWLSIDDPKICLIDHTEIIDKEFLPTFNSHVIEAHLHRIKDLSEHFIYFNDDVFVAKPLDKTHFFRANGIASLFLANKSLSQMKNKGIMTPTLSASLGAIQLLQREYNHCIDMPLVHSYIPLRKSSFEQVWQTYSKEIYSFLPNKFRTNSDLNLASFFVPWVMYLEAKAVYTPEICYYFNIRSPNALQQYKKLLHKKTQPLAPHSFCANDFASDTQQVKEYQRHLEITLKQYFID